MATQPLDGEADPTNGIEQAATNAMMSTSTSFAEDHVTDGEVEDPDVDFERGFRFWTIIIGLGITTLLASLEHTVVTTAAPYILQDLDMKENFIWITNAFFVCRFVDFPSFPQEQR
jgi:hypothetical protein